MKKYVSERDVPFKVISVSGDVLTLSIADFQEDVVCQNEITDTIFDIYRYRAYKESGFPEDNRIVLSNMIFLLTRDHYLKPISIGTKH